MNHTDFSELVKSIRQAGEIRRGERPPARKRTIDPPDIGAIRGHLNLTQTEFASLLGVSPRTVQNWEQKLRKPSGPALALLRIAEKRPETLLEALHS